MTRAIIHIFFSSSKQDACSSNTSFKVKHVRIAYPSYFPIFCSIGKTFLSCGLSIYRIEKWAFSDASTYSRKFQSIIYAGNLHLRLLQTLWPFARLTRHLQRKFTISHYNASYFKRLWSRSTTYGTWVITCCNYPGETWPGKVSSRGSFYVGLLLFLCINYTW